MASRHIERPIRRQKDKVADALAHGLDYEQVAARLWMSKKAVSARMTEIRRDLGWQAV